MYRQVESYFFFSSSTVPSTWKWEKKKHQQHHTHAISLRVNKQRGNERREIEREEIWCLKKEKPVLHEIYKFLVVFFHIFFAEREKRDISLYCEFLSSLVSWFCCWSTDAGDVIKIFILYIFSGESSEERKIRKILVPFIWSVFLLLLLPSVSAFEFTLLPVFPRCRFHETGFSSPSKRCVIANFREAVAQRTTESKQLLTQAFRSGEATIKIFSLCWVRVKLNMEQKLVYFYAYIIVAIHNAPSLLNVYTHFFTFAFKRDEADEA